MTAPQDPRDSALDSLRDAVDPLEAHHASDPGNQVPLLTQVFRFGVTGVLAAVVDYGLLMVGLHLGLGHVLAKSISFVAGTMTAYLINRRWTFAAAPSRSRFLAVMALYAVMFGVQVGIYAVLVGRFQAMHWSDFWVSTVAYVIAQGVATVTNFIVQRTVIFRLR